MAPRDDDSVKARRALELDPRLTITRLRANPLSSNATFLKQRERYYAGLRMAGAPEG